jgi:hypothetical protein
VVKFNVAVPLSQMLGVPTLNTAVGLAYTVIVPVAVVKPVVLELVLDSSVTLTNVYDLVDAGVPVATLKPTPLVTLLTVMFALPSLYTTVNVPPPLLEVYVN